MFESDPVFGLLARAIDIAAMRQAVHVTNIANADVTGFHRLEVSLDAPEEPLQLQPPGMQDDPMSTQELSEELGDESGVEVQPRVMSTGDSVRLDQEMASMAKDALRYEMLLGAFERTTGLLDLAVHEGRGG